MKQIVLVLMIGVAVTSCKTKFKKTKEGFPYTVFSDGKGEKIQLGNVILYHITNKLEDSLLNTSYGETPKLLSVPKDGPGKEEVMLFLDARKGDSILIVQPIDSILAKNPQAAGNPLFTANKGKFIKTYIKIVDVYKDEATANQMQESQALEGFKKDPAIAQQNAKDEAEINAYLKANGINTTRTLWGAYMQVVTPGNSQTAKAGQFVSLRYTGKLLNGEVFETNTKPGDQPLVMQMGVTRMIQGFNDAVKQMSKGEKAIVYIPSVIGYGAQGGQPNEKGVQVIKPNANLIFELEVVDITDQQPTPPPMPQPDTTRK